MKRTVPSRLSISSAKQGGLAGSNLAGKDYQALAFADPVKKGSVGLLVNRIGVKETWVRGNIKVLLSKAEMGVIHLPKTFDNRCYRKPRAKALDLKFFFTFLADHVFSLTVTGGGAGSGSSRSRLVRVCTVGQ